MSVLKQHGDVHKFGKSNNNNSKVPIDGLRITPLLLFMLLLLSTVAFALLLISDDLRRTFGQREAANRISQGQGAMRRMRRQILPADNVRVYATNSNVSVTDKVQVLSAESRIQLLESHLNATVWSNGSLLQMSANGQQVALSASQAIALTMAMTGGARVEGAGDSLQLNESSHLEAGTDWQSRMEAELAGRRVNLSWLDADGTVGLRALDARVAALVSLDWERPGQAEQLSVLSAPAATANGTERELSIVADSPLYQVQIRLVGAETALAFRGARLDIPPAHRSLLLRWQGWRLMVQSLESPFEVRASAKDLRISCYEEGLSLRVADNSIAVDVVQLLLVNRSSSSPSPSLRINGGQIQSPGADGTELAELLSRELHLALSRDPLLGQSVLADARHSQLKLAHANRTSATLTAMRHFVEMLGGQPWLELRAGNVSVQMSAAGQDVEGMAQLDTEILPRELLASQGEDIFGIGPLIPTAWPMPTPPTTTLSPIVRPVPSSSLSTSPPTVSTTIPSTTTTPTTASAVEAPAPTPLMARPDELFTFRQSFPTAATPSQSTPTVPSQGEEFPSPQAQLFTFPPSDADFLVGQFETPAALAGHLLPATSAPFPISATISALQMPPEGAVDDEFRGIRRESRRLIWRPEELLEAASSERTLETSNNEMEPRRVRQITLPPSKTGQGRPEILLEVAIGPEEDLHERRLREELRQGIERLLNDGSQTEGRIRFTVGHAQLEPVEANAGAIRLRLSLEGPSGEEALERLAHVKPDAVAQALGGHQLLSAPRLANGIASEQQQHSPLARSPALASISAHSLPVLPLGMLALTISLLAMLLAMRPLARVMKKAGKWMCSVDSNATQLPS